MSLSMILAMDRNRLIGSNNALPWRLPADLAYFKHLTTGHPVIMGRLTYESLGRPLPKRHNVVITRNPKYKAEGCEILQSIEAAVEAFRNQEAFIIGGAEIYKQAMPYADQIYITYIDHEFEGDTYFPEIDEKQWELTSSEPGVTDEKNPYTYYFRIYSRK